MMYKKLRISLIFSKLVVSKLSISNHRMHNLYTKFVKILGICKQFSNNLVNEQGNIPRRGPVSKFSDLEILQEYRDRIPNLISRRQFNDRRKKTAELCEEIRKRLAHKMDGEENFFIVDSKPIEVFRVAGGKRSGM